MTFVMQSILKRSEGSLDGLETEFNEIDGQWIGISKLIFLFSLLFKVADKEDAD